ncbi:MAG: SSS family solute:Na+ symporter [Chlamydiales bacterium]
MSDSTIVVSIVVAYLVLCLVVGMLPGKRGSESAAGYVAGDRTLGLFVMYFITGATIFSAFAFLGAPGRAFSRGVGACYILGFGTLGFLPFYFLGPRAARLGKAFGFVTQAEMIATRFRTRGIALVMMVISVLAFVPYLALQMRGAGMVLEIVTEGQIKADAGAAIIYGVVLIYVLKSGVLGVGWTNTFQGVFMLVLAWVMGLYLPSILYGGIGPMFDAIQEARPEMLVAPGLAKGGDPQTWAGYSSDVLVSMIGFSVWPHLFMKAFSARDVRTIKRTVVLYPTFQLFLVPLLLVGFAGILFIPAPLAPDQILPHMLMHTDLSPYMVGLFCAGAVAASMSSGDTIVHATASIVVRDGVVSGLGRKLDPKTERRWIRIMLLPVLVASYLLATAYEKTLVDLLLFSYGPVTQFAPAVVATLFIRAATGPGVLAGLVAGISVIITLDVNGLRPMGIHAGLFGLAANILAMTLVSIRTRRPMTPHQERFLAVASGSEEETPPVVSP